MALGSGNFTAQNKVLPGTYMNFVSAMKADTALSNRGIATIPVELDWGADDEIIELNNDSFINNSLSLFGYAYDDENLKPLREVLKNAKTVYVYKLNSGGVKASCDYAISKYGGTRGNDLKIVIQKNIDNSSMFDVKTVFDSNIVDSQTVSSSAELKENEYVTFNGDTDLAVTAGTALSGGTNGTVDGASHQTYLDKVESYSFNTMGVATVNPTIKQLYVNFVKRMRDEIGAKFQLVLYNCSADYEGVINVKNKCVDKKTVSEENSISYPEEAAAVYWVTGAEALCAVNESCLNRVYDGEYTIDCEYTQLELTQAIKTGEFTFHKVGSDIRVLLDINSLVTETDVKGDLFKENQTIRIVDQIANDVAELFNTKYLGIIPNDADGRTGLWVDVVKILQELQTIRAIENFNENDITITQGENKRSVVINGAITVINAMAQLYMTVNVQ